MSAKNFDALILFTSNLQKAVAFYSAIGLVLEKEQHDDGPIHYVCDLKGVHFALYEAKPGQAVKRGIGGGMQFGVQVDSLDEAVKACGAKTLIEPQSVPWGRRAVVEDPDGRPVELNQAVTQ